MSLLAASEVATQFIAVVASVTALVGGVLKVIERNIGAALAYIAVSLIALGIALQGVKL